MSQPLRSLVLACLLCGCGVEPAASGEDPATDAGSESSTTDAGGLDAGHDAGFEEEKDAGVEEKPDAGFPEEPDAGEEEPVDAGVADAGGVDAGEPAQGGLASGVKVRHVALFQAVKVPLASDGVEQARGRAPVVAGREAVVRAWVEGSLAARVGQLEISADGQKLTVESFDAPQTFPDVPGLQAISFQVPAAFVQPQARYRVRVIEPGGGVEVAQGVAHDARFPPDGTDAPLEAQPDPGTLRVTLVPVQYDTDGSHRLPDTSPGQLERMRSLLHAVYPATEVELTVGEPMPWKVGLKFTKNVDLGALNNRIAQRRESDGAPFDAYYYGLISPAESLSAHCGRILPGFGCTTGQSWLVSDPSDADLRAGSGMGFSGDDSVWTLLHELGHMHGRAHAPCKASGDSNYPHSGALIGTWGYDATTGDLVDPGATKDFMSYCDPTWVSDYTWNALYERISAVNAAAFRVEPDRIPTFLVDVGDEGPAQAQRLPAVSAQVGDPGVPVALLSVDGSVLGTVTSRVVPLSHGGVTLFVPAPSLAVATLAFNLDGVEHRVPVAQ